MTTVNDSRRLTGPNLDLPGAGAVLVVDLPDGPEGDRLVEAWERNLDAALAAVGWGGATRGVRRFPGGASLAFAAPLDALYAATEVNEWAWAAAAGDEVDRLPAAVEQLRTAIADEANPPLMALAAAAGSHGVMFLSDDDAVSVGTGTGSVTWPARELPAPEDVDWPARHDVPIALVTGTNGKTTTTRLLGAICRAAGHVPGYTSTDGIHVGDALLDAGDWSGPGGARAVLRHTDVDVALLETARGGMLRRGLAVPRADVAVITNVAEDHVGEYGIFTMEDMAAAKFIVAHAIDDTGRLVLDADDEASVAYAPRVDVPILWFGLDPEREVLAAAIAAGADACWLDGGQLLLQQAGRRRAVADVADVPITWGGAARHNVANALAAVAVAGVLGVDDAAIAAGLSGFSGSAGDNPGRLNVYDLGGVRAVVDFAHNPHGVTALVVMARELPARRRLVVLGQAGDRDDRSIRELTAAVTPLAPDRVVIKEMQEHARGRPAGEVAEIIAAELRRQGVPSDAIEHAGSELEAVRRSLAWARPGDLLLLLTHAERGDVLQLMDRLRASGWRPGEPVAP